DRAAYASSYGFTLRFDQQRRVAAEANDGAIGTFDILRDSHHHRLHDLALLHAAARYGLFHGHADHVADRRIFALRATEHLDAHDTARAGIVRHVEIGLHLDHDAASPFPRLLRSHDLLLLASNHLPAPELVQWPALLDPDDIVRVVFLGLVVGVIFLRPPHGLLHHWLREAA